MPAHSRSQNGVASLAYVAGIHVLIANYNSKDVDGRNKSGHDERVVVYKCPYAPRAEQTHNWQVGATRRRRGPVRIP
jgi:hypothetical protein